MSAPNFKTMSDFPLIVAEPQYRKVCPGCGLSHCDDAETCEECGTDLSSVEAEYDDLAAEDDYSNMKWYADKANEEQDFFTVTVESGYYTGLQFYVEEKYDDIEEWSNDDAQYEFGMSRSEMLRKYKAAGNAVRKMLAKAKEDLCLTELSCMGVFSNGEAVYRKVA